MGLYVITTVYADGDVNYKIVDLDADAYISATNDELSDQPPCVIGAEVLEFTSTLELIKAVNKHSINLLDEAQIMGC